MGRKVTVAGRAEIDAAVEKLREFLKPGDTVFGIVKHVSKSGMSRSISFYKMYQREDGQIDYLWLSHLFATALDWPFDEKHEAVKVQGCGMDMIFHTVYSVSRRLFPQGFGEKCTDQGCSFRAETEEDLRYEAKYLTHTFHGRNGDTSGWDTDGGYALNYKSL